jgi:hypothetical protein
LPGIPLTARTAELFSSLRGRFDRVYAFDASAQQWRSYDERVPYGQQLSEVSAWQGLWVHTPATTTWQVRCIPQTEVTIPLRAGWNLVGYPLEGARSVSQAVATLGGRLRSVFGYDAADLAQPWRSYLPDVPPPVNSLAVLSPGKGYWIEVTEACAWPLRATP